jgi:signal transduction histidine kinase
MTLSRKIILRSAALLLGVLMLGVASLAGLWTLYGQMDVAVDEYSELRLLEAVAVSALTARGDLLAAEPDFASVRGHLRQAVAVLARYAELQSEAQEGSAKHEESEREQASRALASLRGIVARCEGGGGAGLTADDRRGMALEIQSAVSRLDRLIAEADALVARTGPRASRRLRTTTLVLSGLFLVIVAGTVIVSVFQHRGVLRPLRAMVAGVRSVAGGNFAERLTPAGDKEFAELATEFNRMAAELEGLYRELEEKVEAKSRELVRSERLASVGFLAAGVAHEINNPLHIISGYAELSLKRLGPAADCGKNEDARSTLQIIRDEAFRCKQITGKLLSLSRPGTESHKPICLAAAAADVVSIVRAHQACAGRRLVADLSEALMTRGNEVEIKQVLLNLMINSLEAVEAGSGVVSVSGGRVNGCVEVHVSDNGCGMTPEVLEHVFEPFFSTKRGSAERGVGLGLAISHAIARANGGSIIAESAGRGTGSRFTLRLPSAQGGDA